MVQGCRKGSNYSIQFQTSDWFETCGGASLETSVSRKRRTEQAHLTTTDIKNLKFIFYLE